MAGDGGGKLDPTSWASSGAVRRNMQANRGRDTGPELAVRSLLHSRGLRYRVNYRCPVLRRRTIDIAFTRVKVAVFIDGCYWHRCPEHFVMPKSNAEFWAAKLEANVRRDFETAEALMEAGWTVLRFWEHESPDSVADRIVRCVCRDPRVGPRQRLRF
jgi:DNA mismatch endonuclease (patch repair protein)